MEGCEPLDSGTTLTCGIPKVFSSGCEQAASEVTQAPGGNVRKRAHLGRPRLAWIQHLWWFAVGFHIAFDYMQIFVIGTPNGDQVPVGRLLDVSFHGPAWLTGGVLGTEASFLMYPLIALAWLYVGYRFRGTARPAC